VEFLTIRRISTDSLAPYLDGNEERLSFALIDSLQQFVDASAVLLGAIEGEK
jgi:hypothetical protein